MLQMLACAPRLDAGRYEDEGVLKSGGMGAIHKLRDHANVADRTAAGTRLGWPCERWNDGHAWHAPVGSFAANPWGLHDVLGNLFEWCRDWEQTEVMIGPPGDGLKEGLNDVVKVHRGGSYSQSARRGRSADRDGNNPTLSGASLGLRPIIAL